MQKIGSPSGLLTRLGSAAVLALGLTGAAQAALVGHYTFDGNADDSATADGAQNLTLSGNAALISPGLVGSGQLSLDGSGDFASTTTGTDGFTNGAAVTISAWFTPGGNITGAGSDDFGLVAMPIDGLGLGSNGATLEISNGTIQGGGRSATTDGFVGSAVNIVLASGTTYFAATVIDFANDSITTYLYNASTSAWASNTVTNVGFDAAVGSGNQGLWIGSRGVPDRFFNGVIDDVRIYNHGLSETDIQGLIPEPASLALLGFGGLLTLSRRRA